MGCANGKNMEATFYLYYNSGDVVDIQGEMKKMNDILSRFDEEKAWKRRTVFKVGAVESWPDHEFLVTFVFFSVPI